MMGSKLFVVTIIVKPIYLGTYEKAETSGWADVSGLEVNNLCSGPTEAESLFHSHKEPLAHAFHVSEDSPAARGEFFRGHFAAAEVGNAGYKAQPGQDSGSLAHNTSCTGARGMADRISIPPQSR
jgi:hypothetical protein